MRVRFGSFILFIFVVIALAAFGSSARAADSYDACTSTITSLPVVIATQGTWCMNKDLATAMASGSAVTIANNNVTIDCNGYKLGGLAAGTTTQTSGIYSSGRYNVTVRGCNIRGFRVGISLVGGGAGHRIERNRLEGNTLYGVGINSGQTVIRDNYLLETGGATDTADPSAAAIFVQGPTDIIGNTVSGVSSNGEGSAYGIFAGVGPVLVRDNSVRDVFPVSETGSAFGIFTAALFVSVRGNDLFNAGDQGAIGIYCTVPLSNGARDNVVAGFGTPISGCGQTLHNQTF